MAKRRLFRLAGLGGIFFVVMQMVGQVLIQVGGMEPAFTAPADEIIQFFRQRDTTLFAIGGYLSALSVVPYFWFLGALGGFLRRSEGEVGWLSITAVGSGLVIPAFSMIGGWELAMFRLGDNLEPGMVRLLFDAGNFAFAGTWVISGSMLLAVSALGMLSGNLPRWFSWFGTATAVGLLAARAVWTTQIAFVPYTLFWLWMIVMSLILFRNAAASVPNA